MGLLGLLWCCCWWVESLAVGGVESWPGGAAVLKPPPVPPGRHPGMNVYVPLSPIMMQLESESNL